MYQTFGYFSCNICGFLHHTVYLSGEAWSVILYLKALITDHQWGKYTSGGKKKGKKKKKLASRVSTLPLWQDVWDIRVFLSAFQEQPRLFLQRCAAVWRKEQALYHRLSSKRSVLGFLITVKRQIKSTVPPKKFLSSQSLLLLLTFLCLAALTESPVRRETRVGSERATAEGLSSPNRNWARGMLLLCFCLVAKGRSVLRSLFLARELCC